jgi:hypothetical protein
VDEGLDVILLRILVCALLGHRYVERVRYERKVVVTVSGCSRCGRGEISERPVRQYPLPRSARR